MAYALVATNGHQFGATSWTHTFTLNNLCAVQTSNDSTVTYAAGNFKDSSGTPKNLTLDKTSGVFTTCAAAAFSLVVPSGFTSPLVAPSTVTWIAQEWSGNATSSVADVTNSTGSSAAINSPHTGASINTGSNAGLVVTAFTLNTQSATSGLTVTGTSFSDTFSTSHDGTDQNDSADDGGTFNWRTSNVASAAVNNAWSWTGGTMNNSAEVIISYNAAAGGGAVEIAHLLLLGVT